MHTADFNFFLPSELIAQHPLPDRDDSRLLVLDRSNGSLAHRTFRQLLDYLRPGDVLVLNDSKVIPARLRGKNRRTSGQFELLLLKENAVNDWWVMLRPGKRARVGTEIVLALPSGELTSLAAVVREINDEGHRRVQFVGAANILDELPQLGEVPLPPYIERTDRRHESEDAARYQTVYARSAGSVAAPTAGLHFTTEILDRARAKGVAVAFVTLHVGLGTFAPVKAERLRDHRMHEERYFLSEPTVETIERARAAGGRVFAAGTTTLRVLESVAAEHGGKLRPGPGRTRIFIFPPYEFKVADALVTNFHLPKSTLLMLASAFAAPGQTRGRETVLRAYDEAVRLRYRFFSYGDAMLIL